MELWNWQVNAESSVKHRKRHGADCCLTEILLLFNKEQSSGGNISGVSLLHTLRSQTTQTEKKYKSAKTACGLKPV